MARPKKVIDEELVAQLAFDGASNREIAAIVGCDDKTIANRFSALAAKKRAERRVQLRKAQTSAALAGNGTMLVWLGKQELDQRDRIVVQPPSDNTPRIKTPHYDKRLDSAKRKPK